MFENHPAGYMLPFVDQNSLQSQLAPVPVEEQLYVFNDTNLYTCACADFVGKFRRLGPANRSSQATIVWQRYC